MRLNRKRISKWGLPGVVGFGLLLALASPLPVRAVRGPATPPSVQAIETPEAAVPAPVSASLPTEALGSSGRLRALIGTSATLLEDPSLRGLLSNLEIENPGIHALGALAPDGDSVSVLSLIPYAEKKGAMLRGYRVGFWPSDGMTQQSARYKAPEGFIEVTAENQRTSVSENFRLRDFLTHDQVEVWPKFLVLRPALLDKLELLSQELERSGLPSRLHVMSGFRTPQYNAQGVGKGGRASHSRHMYGDAADVFIDVDGNGMMDDVNGDGKITRADAQILLAAAERVESAHPELIGGLSAYPSNGVHGPFVHVDARGVRARW